MSVRVPGCQLSSPEDYIIANNPLLESDKTSVTQIARNDMLHR